MARFAPMRTSSARPVHFRDRLAIARGGRGQQLRIQLGIGGRRTTAFLPADGQRPDPAATNPGSTGSAAPVLQVTYEKNYVHNGFNPPKFCGIADPETFLRVTNDPLPKLDMGDHGDQGGTVARPAKIIAGLNRRFGIAGPPLPDFKDCRPVAGPTTDKPGETAPASVATGPSTEAAQPPVPDRTLHSTSAAARTSAASTSATGTGARFVPPATRPGNTTTRVWQPAISATTPRYLV